MLFSVTFTACCLLQCGRTWTHACYFGCIVNINAFPILLPQISANLSHKMLIKMQHAIFDDIRTHTVYCYVCNMHASYFFVQGVLVPGGQPNLWVSASLNHKLVPHQITAPCFSHFLAPVEEEQTLETFCQQLASNLDHQWDCSLSENNAIIFTYYLSV